MATYKPTLDFTIPDPCSADWDDMQGDVRKRHCAACDRDVHNLAAMTPRQIDALFSGAGADGVWPGGHAPCVRMARYDDGSLLVAEEARSLRPYGAMAGAVMAALVTISSVAASAQQQVDQTRTLGKMAVPTAVYSGEVLGADGRPAAGATVSLTRTLYGHNETQRATTDAHGTFRITVRPGDWQMQAVGSSSVSATEPVRVEAGEHRAAKALQLRPVTVTAGAPVAVGGMILPIKPVPALPGK